VDFLACIQGFELCRQAFPSDLLHLHIQRLVARTTPPISTDIRTNIETHPPGTTSPEKGTTIPTTRFPHLQVQVQRLTRSLTIRHASIHPTGPRPIVTYRLVQSSPNTPPGIPPQYQIWMDFHPRLRLNTHPMNPVNVIVTASSRISRTYLGTSCSRPLCILDPIALVREARGFTTPVRTSTHVFPGCFTLPTPVSCLKKGGEDPKTLNKMNHFLVITSIQRQLRAEGGRENLSIGAKHNS
jgi:hypothetical protein